MDTGLEGLIRRSVEIADAMKLRVVHRRWRIDITIKSADAAKEIAAQLLRIPGATVAL